MTSNNQRLLGLLTAIIAVGSGALLGCEREPTTLPPGYKLMTDGFRWKYASDAGSSVSDFSTTNQAIYWANKSFKYYQAHPDELNRGQFHDAQ